MRTTRAFSDAAYHLSPPPRRLDPTAYASRRASTATTTPPRSPTADASRAAPWPPRRLDPPQGMLLAPRALRFVQPFLGVTIGRRSGLNDASGVISSPAARSSASACAFRPSSSSVVSSQMRGERARSPKQKSRRRVRGKRESHSTFRDARESDSDTNDRRLSPPGTLLVMSTSRSHRRAAPRRAAPLRIERSGAKQSEAERNGAQRSEAERSGAKRSGAKRSESRRSGAKRSESRTDSKVPRARSRASRRGRASRCRRR